MQLVVTGVDYSGNLIWREQFKISKRKLLLAYLSSEGMNDEHPVMYIWGLNADGMRKACEKKTYLQQKLLEEGDAKSHTRNAVEKGRDNLDEDGRQRMII